ncbi:hypothetical protein PALB_8080 [Pseudoalteromonas luteoviolacea B = ATCC 29581]|nr:hypothetical protein PALB_8080 [Pseudoalteromonas luteoviolacea B = ATCC 29581]
MSGYVVDTVLHLDTLAIMSSDGWCELDCHGELIQPIVQRIETDILTHLAG